MTCGWVDASELSRSVPSRSGAPGFRRREDVCVPARDRRRQGCRRRGYMDVLAPCLAQGHTHPLRPIKAARTTLRAQGALLRGVETVEVRGDLGQIGRAHV